MKLQIVNYNETLRTVWDNLVESSINGTFLHSRSFFDHNPLNKNDDHSLLFFKKKELVAIIPFICYEKEGRKILHSYLRSTYGGFVINTKVGIEEAIEMVGKVIEEAKKINTHDIIIRNPFRIFNQLNCDETDYAMWYHGFQIKSRELEATIKLSKPQEMESLFDDSTRRNIKKGKLSLVIQESTDYERYWEILEANLESKHKAKPTHSFLQFKALLEKVGNDKIKLFVAKLEGTTIAGILIFIANSTTLHAQYIASDLNFQTHRPLDLLISTIADWGYTNGFKYFNLGTANENNGSDINYGLFRFKEGFGARGVLRETMLLSIKATNEI